TLEPLQADLGAYASTFAEMRQRERVHLSDSQVERLIALGFALEQLQRNMIDLARCVREWAASPRRVAECQRGADGHEKFALPHRLPADRGDHGRLLGLAAHKHDPRQGREISGTVP